MLIHVPESGWVSVQANGLNFACFDKGTGPLVLLLHGFPDTPHTWDLTWPLLLKAGYRVVMPFIRGYVPSQAPPRDDFGVETLGRDVIGLIDALGAERAVVVGHDWGAMAGWAAATLAPERIERFVAMAIPHPASLKPTLRKVWGVRHFWTLRLPGAEARFAADDFAAVRTLYERWSPGFVWEEAEFEAVKNAFAAPGCVHAALGYVRQLAVRPPAWFRAPIRVPTLVVGGLTDGVADPGDFEACARFVDAPFELAMLPGGHFLHREHPEAFHAALLSWLAR